MLKLVDGNSGEIEYNRGTTASAFGSGGHPMERDVYRPVTKDGQRIEVRHVPKSIFEGREKVNASYDQQVDEDGTPTGKKSIDTNLLGEGAETLTARVRSIVKE